MKYQVSYIGNYYKIAEMLLFEEKIELISVICEREKVTDDLITFSLVRNIELIVVGNKKELIEQIRKMDEVVHFFIMCSFGRRIPMEELPDIRIFNIHYSALPYYKGRHPTYWATVSREKEIGISIHTVNEKIDEGDIIAQEKVPYYLWMNEQDLFDALTQKVPELLKKCISYIEGQGEPIPNQPGYYYPAVTEDRIRLDLHIDSFAAIYNKVRAQARYRGAKLIIEDQVFWIQSVRFTRCSLDRPYLIQSDGSLLIRINDEICLKSDRYEKEVT